MRTHRIGKLDIDQPRLLKELERIAHFDFTEIFHEYNCGGPWKTCLLWNIGGEASNGTPTNYGKTLVKTKYAEQLPYLVEVIERSFNLKHLNHARLSIISNIVIIPHKDYLRLNKAPSPEQSTHRVHVPLVTNENCYFSEGNVVYQMRFGEAWFFDASSLHSAASFSEQNRVHLMLDFVDVNDESELVNFGNGDHGVIPQESICARSKMADAERDALLSLASIIDMDNYKDIFSIVIKKHYRKDRGDNFFWDTLMEIATSSNNQAVGSKINEMYKYFREST
jgi:hypothetical protein